MRIHNPALYPARLPTALTHRHAQLRHRILPIDRYLALHIQSHRHANLRTTCRHRGFPLRSSARDGRFHCGHVGALGCIVCDVRQGTLVAVPEARLVPAGAGGLDLLGHGRNAPADWPGVSNPGYCMQKKRTYGGWSWRRTVDPRDGDIGRCMVRGGRKLGRHG